MAKGRAWKAEGLLFVALAVGTVLAPTARASAQNLPGWGYAQQFMGQMSRQQQQEQRRERSEQQRQIREQQDAEAREHAPHEASAMYTGQLRPYDDLKRLVTGKTLYLERPIVASRQIQSLRTNEIYFSPDGRSFSAAWSGRPWMTAENQVCLDSIQPQNCWRVFQDDTRELYFVPATNIIMHGARIERGDPANTKQQFAQRQQQEQAQANMLLGVLGVMSAVSSESTNSGKNCIGPDPAHGLYNRICQ